MAPTIVTRDGRPFLALGSPGGASIITTVLQVLLERLDLGATLPEAIARPRAASATRPPPRPSPPSSTRRRARRCATGSVTSTTPTTPWRSSGRSPASSACGRPAACRRGAGPPRWRQRRGRAPLEFRGVPQRRLLALGCLATVAAADYTLLRRKPRWILIGLFDHPAHLATAGLLALNAPRRLEALDGRLPGRLAAARLDHLPLALRAAPPAAGRPAPGQPLSARDRARCCRGRSHAERAPARRGHRDGRPLPARPRRGQRRAAAVAGHRPLVACPLFGVLCGLRISGRTRTGGRRAVAVTTQRSRNPKVRSARCLTQS